MDTCKWLYSLWISWDEGMTPRPKHLQVLPSVKQLSKERSHGAHPPPARASFRIASSHERPCEENASMAPQPPGAEKGGWDAAHMRNSDVTENLGQVSVVLSDKTGTLTNNVMSLKALTVPRPAPPALGRV
jgi:hypothetical protein